MHPKQRWLALLQLIGGPAVLGSYVYCFLAYPDTVTQSWGGVPESIQGIYTAWMFVAAAGYFAYSYLFIFRTDPEQAKILGRGYGLLGLFYALVLIPSAIWMPATMAFISDPEALGFWVIRVDLYAVALGSIGLIVAALTIEPRPPTRLRALAIAGAIGFSVQTVILDGLVWPALFPTG